MDGAVLYFGGDYIGLCYATRAVNNTFVTNIETKAPYSGIVDGEFCDPNEIPATINKLLTDAKAPRFGTLTVGVPSSFCTITATTNRKTFAKSKKLSERDVAQIVGKGHAVYFKIDDGAPVMRATGLTVMREIEVQTSVVTISAEFKRVLGTAGLLIKTFKNIQFVPVVSAEAHYLIPSFVRDAICVLISSKMFSTTVAAIVGDEIVGMKTIDIGTAHLVNDISLNLRIPYNEAVQKFETYDGRGSVEPIISSRVNGLAEHIYGTIREIDRELLQRPVYICGGHVDNVAGAVEAIGKKLGTSVTKLVCPLYENNPADLVSNNSVVAFSIYM